MNIYQMDYVVEKVAQNEPANEQKLLKKLAGRDFTEEEARFVWEKIGDHKWYLGERLKRDVGLKVATVDYIENFYDAGIFRKSNKRSKSFFDRIFKPVRGLTRTYFVVKDKTVSHF